MESNVYRDGKVHIVAERCKTCIFRPGNKMMLTPGRVKDLVDAARSVEGGNIPCHSTIYRPGVDQAICRGFWDGYALEDNTLRMAARLGIVVEDQLQEES